MCRLVFVYIHDIFRTVDKPNTKLVLGQDDVGVEMVPTDLQSTRANNVASSSIVS